MASEAPAAAPTVSWRHAGRQSWVVELTVNGRSALHRYFVSEAGARKCADDWARLLGRGATEAGSTATRPEETKRLTAVPAPPRATHPLQPLVRDPSGVIRFRENAIVRYLLEASKQGRRCDLNALAILPFTQEDREQFAQLIGYSLSGFGDLSYVSKGTYARAEAQEVLEEGT